MILLPEKAPQQTLDPMKIAVLPFVSLSEPPDDEYFVDGLSEEIMRALGSVPDIRVVAKTSSFAFRKSKEDARTIGRELSAGSVLAGTVRREGGRIRVTAQVTDANTGRPIWSEAYDRRALDVFDVQDQISTAVAARLVDGLKSGQHLVAAPTATSKRIRCSCAPTT